MYASFVLHVLSLCGNVNTRRMSKPDMGSIFYINNQWHILVIGKLLCELSKLSKFNAFNLLGYTRRTLRHLFLFTNSTQRELVSICTQSIWNCNQLSLHYILEVNEQTFRAQYLILCKAPQIIHGFRENPRTVWWC